MLIKKHLGKTLSEMGFVTKQQLNEALLRQIQIMIEQTMYERLHRASLVTNARLSKDAGMAPLPG